MKRGLLLWLCSGLVACGSSPEAPPSDPGDVPSFSVGGLIADLSGEPVVDVFVTVSTEFCIPGRSDQEGTFEVQEVVAGPKRLITYGETASSALVASVSFAFDADSDHIFDSPIKLPRLDETWPLDEAAAGEQLITTDDGLVLTVAIGSLALAPFAPSELQVARVPVEDAAGFIPAGVDLVDLFVLHPILSTLDPPAAVAFPDDLGLPEGTPVLFHSLDYELGQLVVVATGVVGQDGRPRTEDGQGIPELTWLGLSVEDEE